MTNTPEIRWPAEWEPQDAIWFSWPHRVDTFTNKLDQLYSSYIKLITSVSSYQKVCINADKNLWESINRHLPNTTNIELYDHATNDVWCRDHGATFVLKNNKVTGVDWQFNAWGGKFPPWELDNQVAQKMHTQVSGEDSLHQPIHSPLFLEGGAIEGNGAGLVITTEAVALNKNRNPKASKSDIEAELLRCLGAEKVFWLPKGIIGDDTDGHIDDLTRFVKEDVILTAIEKSNSSPNYHILAENKERLEDIKTLSGSSIEIIDLPMPEPIRVKNWRLQTLPASYANFLIINDAVLVPTFAQPKNDDRAVGIISECFPERDVLGINSTDFIYEGGAIHCLSQQQPKALK